MSGRVPPRHPGLRSHAPHAPNAIRTGRVRRHRPDGVQDKEERQLPVVPRHRLHVRDGRHPAFPNQPAGPADRPAHRVDAQPEHRRRDARFAQAVPRRFDSYRVPAHRHHRRRRLDAVSRPATRRRPARAGGGRLPRGARRRSPRGIPGRPAGFSAGRGRYRRRDAHPGGGERRRPARLAAVAFLRASALWPRFRPPGCQRQHRRLDPGGDQGGARYSADPQAGHGRSVPPAAAAGDTRPASRPRHHTEEPGAAEPRTGTRGPRRVQLPARPGVRRRAGGVGGPASRVCRPAAPRH